MCPLFIISHISCIILRRLLPPSYTSYTLIQTNKNTQTDGYLAALRRIECSRTNISVGREGEEDGWRQGALEHWRSKHRSVFCLHIYIRNRLLTMYLLRAHPSIHPIGSPEKKQSHKKTQQVFPPRARRPPSRLRRGRLCCR
jgi:hypothetical protein